MPPKEPKGIAKKAASNKAAAAAKPESPAAAADDKAAKAPRKHDRAGVRSRAAAAVPAKATGDEVLEDANEEDDEEAPVVEAPKAKPAVAAKKAKAKPTPKETKEGPATPHYSIVLTDIEGTTTSISFVHDVLFPYASNNASTFITERWDTDDELKPLLEALRVQAAEDIAAGVANVPDLTVSDKEKAIEAHVAYIQSLIKEDRKIAALKNFQGYIWKFAYEDGSVKGQLSLDSFGWVLNELTRFVSLSLLHSLFADVHNVLKAWQKREVPVYIYSSGSVAAQKLLFKYSDAGDLLPMFKGHYDTLIGSKLEAKSYVNIAKSIGVSPSEILFLSDNVKEIEAAHKAKYVTCILNRPGNAAIEETEDHQHILPSGDAIRVVTNFDALFGFFPVRDLVSDPVTGKKRKAEEESVGKTRPKNEKERDAKKAANKVAKADEAASDAMEIVDEKPVAAVPAAAGKKGGKKGKAAVAPSTDADVAEEKSVPAGAGKKGGKKGKAAAPSTDAMDVVEEKLVAATAGKKGGKKAVAAVAAPVEVAASTDATVAAAAGKKGGKRGKSVAAKENEAKALVSPAKRKAEEASENTASPPKKVRGARAVAAVEAKESGDEESRPTRTTRSSAAKEVVSVVEAKVSKAKQTKKKVAKK
ncbi:Enolase-phosphatase E1 [Podochytrium sp. JEL0797]|nr:Enolase-phosphatase E1 [Podochytrium sp. JEL0797]